MPQYCSYLSQFPRLKHAFFELKETSYFFQKKKGTISLEEKSFPLFTLKQIHGAHVQVITEAPLEILEGDGLVTSLKNIALGILTADCGPILFYDSSTHIIGACHAGWKGARKGILQQTIQAMEDLGAQRSKIFATLGPTIQQQNYEVGPEFPDLIGREYSQYFYASPKKGYHYFNLPLYIQDILLKEKITHVHDLKKNTFSGPFASRRRSLQEGDQKASHHNLSTIAVA